MKKIIVLLIALVATYSGVNAGKKGVKSVGCTGSVTVSYPNDPDEDCWTYNCSGGPKLGGGTGEYKSSGAECDMATGPQRFGSPVVKCGAGAIKITE